MTLLAIAAVASACAGCGGDDAKRSPPTLTPQEIHTVDAATAAVHGYCREVGLALAGRAPRPTADDEQRVFDAIDRLVVVAQKKPDATYRRISSPRDVIADTAEDLDGTNCSSALVQRLEEGLASLPSP